jgi:hypothetical protein
MRRLLILLIVTLGLAPGTWLRSPGVPPDNRQLLTITPIAPGTSDLGPLRVTGAWQLTSPNRHFHSYSALVALDDGRLLAGSDRGRMLRFAPPGTPPSLPMLGLFAGGREQDKALVDLESLARDPATGRVWAGYEGRNEIARYDASLRTVARTRPAAMRNWGANTGPEAMVRLRDGRFIVLAEANPRWLGDSMPGLLFPDDPVDGARPAGFTFVPPADFRPVDMAQLPDGRVLILLRKVHWGLPPGFSGRLVVADPARIEPGKAWRGETVADLVDPLPTDNYEGLAVVPHADGGATLWLISDDNETLFQRTLLLRFEWPAREKARESPRAP